MSRLGLHHHVWAQCEPARHRFDLADSAVATPDLEALGLPARGAFAGDPPERVRALEQALGARLGAPGGRVRVTAGASEAVAIVFAGLCNPGDEVLVESPGYEPHRAVPRVFGARVRTFARRFPERPGAVASAVEAEIGEATRMAVLTDSHNPTGAALSEEDREALTRLAERNGLWILADETFRDAGDEPPGTVAIRSHCWVSVSTLTKAYGLGSLRIGWIAASEAALARCWDAQNAFSVRPSLPSVNLALDLVPHLDALRERAQRILRVNRERWGALARRRPDLEAAVASRGTTTWCGFGTDGSGDAFSAFAAERFDLAVTPGRFFGDARGVRVALGGEPERFTAALEIFERAVAAFDRAAARA